ncbi:glycoside hydrolase family 3 protein [Podospora aff. communis PSN243]|uniref:xylan 1,4-beta-xylosidase n=1 Tax=Podospora aff. communis PSN243 TaxID=3040156 RepID=A0AAV9GET0_9PEZI|nr:glycoside hydrolase family 3 protein [Podospora aff. communis PSN243]
MKALLVLGSAAAVLAQNACPPSDCSKAPLSNNKVCDRTLSPTARAAALVAAMTRDEKIVNLVSKSPGVARLGLNCYNWWSEALHGVAGAPGIDFTGDFAKATSFPMPVLMAAAFDDDLIFKIASIIGQEARAFGNNGKSGLDYWTPNVNPYRDPRWGRGSETPGEDVARINGYTDAYIRAMEGNKTQRQIIATCKHYAGNDLEALADGTDRHNFNAKITPQELAEYYMPPFRVCARDLNVGSFMCAYNAVNGVPSCGSKYLLQTILREHWNWTSHNNYITSDCEGVADLFTGHKFSPSLAAATADAFNAGMDSSCEYSGGSSDIRGAVNQGLLSEATMNRALTRLYEGLVRAGYFDASAAEYYSLGKQHVNTKEAQQLALQSVVDSVVMLKNEGALPVKAGAKLAMIGFWADDTTKLRGGYSGPPPYLVSPVSAAKTFGLTYTAVNGTTDAAVTAAQQSDVILYFGGLDTSSAAEGRDRTSLAWPSAQLTFIDRLSALGKPIVVIQMGDQVDNTPLLKNKAVSSILWASWPGMEGGTGLMQLITGKKSPAGRLPVTQYPASYSSVPMTDMNLRPSGSSNPGRTYMWFPNPVQAFGYGLHYTTFSPSVGSFPATLATADLATGCKERYVDKCPLPSLPVSVKNTGNATSDYVVLAFVSSSDAGPTPRPIKTLATYGRLRDVKGGDTAEASLKWTLGNLARHDAKGNMVLYPGTYTVKIDEPTLATYNFTVTGEPLVLDEWPQQQ